MVGDEDGEFIYWFKFDDVEPYFSRCVLFFYLQDYLKVETKLKAHNKSLENRRENADAFPASQLQR